MQTRLPESLLATAAGQEADAILRSCVHCGFCTATCPTYQLLGDELDSPRGRIYLIKQMLEGDEAGTHTRQHLDRCLSCRACETTCPSGVVYHRLLDIGREELDRRLPRPHSQRLLQRALRLTLPYPRRFKPLLGLGRGFARLLPAGLRRKLPPVQNVPAWPTTTHARRMLALAGCVQSVTTPATNAVTARVLDRLGIQLIEAPAAGCCGAMSHHFAAGDEARAMMRRNIDAWWPHIEQGAEVILVTASGCGAFVKEYGKLLADDPAYADKAARVSELARDPAEVLQQEDLAALGLDGGGRRVAYHPPCTLQHGQQLPEIVEGILTRLGYQLTPVPDKHLCCGSAGTYSITQPALAAQLRDNKLAALDSGGPELIATANVGCQLHLQSESDRPVRHWIELLEPEAG
ncbi:glycolate oxidase subunit GlcF [Thiohalobacter thiocyanaticus]|uniref:Glycolate oxidase iron-sulfur subunit n=1 Tax=Thiohalobacter thiocyanaticus TaxID=585455 RepID=A0A426QFX4_9GAMM|nr:glycolate oxidase subunit GlcF [Thiohalobacter thiocyanaticus]RRQ20649.1 glycolate oxidase iron-sulfur subunit [Thiohalobacter thiocyanaticus]